MTTPNERKRSFMNTRATSRKWSGIPLNEGRAAATGRLLLLLLTLPGVVQAQIDYPFNYTITNGTITITGYTGPGGEVVIPDTINGLSVTSIRYTAFYNGAAPLPYTLTGITIPDSVTNIGLAAFVNCTSLRNIAIPNSVTGIKNGAFAGCTSLAAVYFQGNAPMFLGPACFSAAPCVFYYLPGTTGWETTYAGHPTALWLPPTIEISPQTQTAEVGSAVDLQVWASGQLLFYQWHFNDTNVISCSPNCQLELTNVQFAEAGAYIALVTNGAGAVTSAPAMLQVIAAVEHRPVAGVKLMGQAGSLLNVDYANVLSPAPSWATLGSASLTSTSQYYFDLTQPLAPQRFYRAWQAGTPSEIPALDLHIVPAITVTGSIGSSVRVDGINQFGPTDAWFTLDTVTLTNTSQLYFDVYILGQPERLYRLVPSP